MLFLSVFATCLTLWVSASQAQYLNADLLKNINKKDYGILSQKNLQLKNPLPDYQGDNPASAKFDGKIGSCEHLQTLWTRFGCKGSIFSQDQLRQFRYSVITLGNEMTVGFLQKYSKVSLPVQMIYTKKSKRFEDHQPNIVKYIQNYLPHVYVDKKLLNHVLNEIDDYLFKPLLKYLEQFPRESLDDYQDYERGKEIAKIIRQYIIDPIDNVVPVSGPSYKQNRPAIVKYIKSHAPGISKTLLNLMLCKIQALVFKEISFESVKLPSEIPPNDLHRLTPDIYQKLQPGKQPITNPSGEDQPGKPKTIQDYLEPEKPGNSVRPERDPLGKDKPGYTVRPEQDPFGKDEPEKSVTPNLYPFQEDEPEKSTITEPNRSKENQSGTPTKTEQDPFEEGRPGKFRPKEERKPKGSIRPGSVPSEEPSDDETDPERDLMLKFLKKYYPEQFGDQISTGDNEVPASQDSAPAKHYLNKEALFKFLEKFYPELLRKKQFMDRITTIYPDVNNEFPSDTPIYYVPAVGTKPTRSPYIVVADPTERPGGSEPATVPTFVVPETVTEPTAPDYVVTKPTSTSPTLPDYVQTPMPLYPPIHVASGIITPKPAPIPRPFTMRLDINRDPYYSTPSSVFPYTEKPFHETPVGPYTLGPILGSPLYPTILPTQTPDKNNIRQKVLERIKKRFPHVSDTFIQGFLKYLEKKMSAENMLSPSVDLSSYMQEYIRPSQEEKPNDVWKYEYPDGGPTKPNRQDTKPTPVPGSSSDEYVPVIPPKDEAGKIIVGRVIPEDDQVPDNTDEPTKPILIEDEQNYAPVKPGTIRLPGKIYANHNIMVHHKGVYKVSRPIYPDMYRNQLLPMPNKEGMSGNFMWNDAQQYQHPMLGMSKLYDPSQMLQHPFQNIPFANAGGGVINLKYSSGGHIYSTNPIPHGNDFMRALYQNNNIGSLLKPSDGTAYSPSTPQFNNIGSLLKPSDGPAYSPSTPQFNNIGSQLKPSDGTPYSPLAPQFNNIGSQLKPSDGIPYTPLAPQFNNIGLQLKPSDGTPYSPLAPQFNNIGSQLKPSDGTPYSPLAPEFNNIGSQLKPSDDTAYNPSEVKFKPLDAQPAATVQEGQNQAYFNNVQLQMNNQLRAELMGLLEQNHLSPLLLRSYGQLYEKLQNGASLSDGEWKEMNELEQMFKSHAAFLQLYQQKFAQTLHGIKSLLYNMYKRLYKMGQTNSELNNKFGTGFGQNYMPGSGGKLFNFGKQSLTPNAENGEVVFRQDDSNPSEQGNPGEEVEKTESGDNMRKSAFVNLSNLGSWIQKPFFS